VLKDNARLILGDGNALRIVGYARPGRPIVVAEGDISIDELLNRDGTLALPHYIHRSVGPADIDDYQTVYAKRPGAIAAPTAGLHFTDEVFKALADAGIRTATVTLHIGPGTFAPVRAHEVESHTMESEWYTIAPRTQAAIEHARRVGGRIVTVGTSSMRALESWAITGDVEGFTGLFIHPGFRFKLADAMLTNFHMPRTTVLALVMAFAGRDQILAAYREAIRHRYRFLSYGDAMLIL
jgi:S-adenosylmethionine:tRNA ribosyltransferase-isomerase